MNPSQVPFTESEEQWISMMIPIFMKAIKDNGNHLYDNVGVSIKGHDRKILEARIRAYERLGYERSGGLTSTIDNTGAIARFVFHQKLTRSK